MRLPGRDTAISAFRNRIRQLMQIKESPLKLALAFSIGVFIGISPLLGLHTVLGLAVAWIFKFNRLATLVGVYVTNPWTIVPIYTFCTWSGARLLGVHEILPDINWSTLSYHNFIETLGALLWPFVVGTVTVGLVASVLSFVLIYQMLKRRDKANSIK